MGVVVPRVPQGAPVLHLWVPQSPALHPGVFPPQGAPLHPRVPHGEQFPSAPQVVNPRKKMKKKKYLNSGTVRTG